jgi:hypothetical protein
MSRVFLVGAVAGLAGCAQLAGIEDTSDQGRGGNSLTVTRLSVGTELEAAPLDLNGLDAMYFVANPVNPAGYDRVLAADEGAGRWRADLVAPAAVEFTLPDVPKPLPRIFELPSAQVSAVYAVLEHPNPTPAPADAMISLTVDNGAPLTASDAFQIYTMGSWTARAIAPGELPPIDGVAQTIALTYPFASSQILSGRGQLDRLTTDDAFFVFRRVGGQLTGYGEVPPFAQTGKDTVAVAIQPVAADQTLDVKIDPTKLATRYASARPAVAGLNMGWSLTAAPGYLLPSTAGPTLHSGGLTMTDVGIMVAYGNPFAARKWNTLFLFATSETRVYTPEGTTTPVQLFAGLNQFMEPSAAVPLDQPAGLPELISLDGKPLSTDGLTIAAPTKFVEVEVVVDPPAGAPAASLYLVQLFDLVANAAGTALEYRFAGSAASTEPKVHLPPELFVAGHTYTLRAIAQVGGLPDVATGDTVTRTLPMAQGFLDSGVFKVMP